MSFSHRPARREAAPVLVGISGPSGGGKTYSALRLARGLANGAPFGMVDTENGRGLHYADFFPEMEHGHLRAPFTPAAYAQAIKTFDDEGFGVIVVDSMSHEWEGDGGILRWQEEEFERLGGRESARLKSWNVPKTAHKRFVQELLQVRAHVILCFRAEDKVEMVKGKDGKSEVRAKETLTSILGWIPISERRLPFELTLSLLVTPDRPGIPRPIKLQEQHKPFVPLDQPLSEETGRLLAEWAAGGESAAQNSAEEKTRAVDVITEPQRTRLYTIATSRKVPTDEVKRIIREVAGVDSSKLIPRSLYDAVTASVEAWEPQQSFEEPAAVRAERGAA